MEFIYKCQPKIQTKAFRPKTLQRNKKMVKIQVEAFRPKS